MRTVAVAPVQWMEHPDTDFLSYYHATNNWYGAQPPLLG